MELYSTEDDGKEKRNNATVATLDGCVSSRLVVLFCLQVVLLYKSYVAWHSVQSFLSVGSPRLLLAHRSPLAAHRCPVEYGDSDLINPHRPSALANSPPMCPSRPLPIPIPIPIPI